MLNELIDGYEYDVIYEDFKRKESFRAVFYENKTNDIMEDGKFIPVHKETTRYLIYDANYVRVINCFPF